MSSSGMQIYYKPSISEIDQRGQRVTKRESVRMTPTAGANGVREVGEIAGKAIEKGALSIGISAEIQQAGYSDCQILKKMEGAILRKDFTSAKYYLKYSGMDVARLENAIRENAKGAKTAGKDSRAFMLGAYKLLCDCLTVPNLSEDQKGFVKELIFLEGMGELLKEDSIALGVAAAICDSETIDWLISEGADPCKPFFDPSLGDRPVYPACVAIDYGNKGVLAQLAPKGIEEIGVETPLTHALKVGDRACINELIRLGHVPHNLHEISQNSVLTERLIIGFCSQDASLSKKQRICFEAILESQTAKDVILRSSEALCLAVVNKQKDLVALLLENEASTNIENSHHLLPIELAIISSQKEIFDQLVDAGGHLDLKGDHTRFTPLARAVSLRRYDCVARLMQEGENKDQGKILGMSIEDYVNTRLGGDQRLLDLLSAVETCEQVSSEDLDTDSS